MRKVTGILEAYGPSVSHRGGMKYNYITVRQDHGRVVNITDVIAFRNVEAAMGRLLQRPEDCRHVTFHLKRDLFVYALEEQGGAVRSDIEHIRTAWLTSIVLTFGLMVIAVALTVVGITFDAKGVGQVGVILFVFSVFPLFMFSGGVSLFWPSQDAAALHRRSL